MNSKTVTFTVLVTITDEAGRWTGGALASRIAARLEQDDLVPAAMAEAFVGDLICDHDPSKLATTDFFRLIQARKRARLLRDGGSD